MSELTEIQFAEPTPGEAFKLYLYGKDGFHSGAIWFTNGRIRYPDEEIAASDAKRLAERNIAEGREVRITNGGDLLVFHSRNGQQLYPAQAEKFWSKV